jgi:hypothetical protein
MGKATMLIHEGNEYCFVIGDNVQQSMVSQWMYRVGRIDVVSKYGEAIVSNDDVVGEGWRRGQLILKVTHLLWTNVGRGWYGRMSDDRRWTTTVVLSSLSLLIVDARSETEEVETRDQEREFEASRDILLRTQTSFFPNY